MERFQYGVLDQSKDEIRIFKVHPAVRRNEPISGNLIVVSLHKRPQYDALSYVWGSSNPKMDIYINGFVFSIGPNLHKAILDLRQERNHLLLWIDAICINQGNPAERQHQVSMMREIYSEANLVRAWLDEHIDPTAKAFREAQRLMLKESQHPDPFSLRSVIQLFRASLPYIFYVVTGIRRELSVDHAFWEPVIRVFDNEYWGRLWIQQEILLARKVVFHFRQHALPEKGLLRFQSAANSHNNIVDGGDFRHGDVFVLNIPGFFDTLVDGRENVRRSRAGSSSIAQDASLLFNMFLDSTNLRVTDPRDRVYGCLGLLSKKQRAQVTVDYSFNLVQTYAQVFKSYIYESSNLDFLCNTFDRAGATQHNLPAWMPAPEKGSIFFLYSFQRYKCSPPPSQLAEVISSDGTVLSVKGFRVDTVQRSGKNELIRRAPILEWVEDVQAMNKEANPYDTSDTLWEKKDFLDLFRMGCTDNSYWHLWRQRPPTYEELSDTLKYLVRQPVELGEPDLSLSTLLENETERGPDNDIILSMGDAVKGSSFFMSATNQLGLVSASNNDLHSESGDSIYIVLGCPKPLVLRPRHEGSQHFLLIGSAVLPRMMDGSFAESFLRQNNAHKYNQDGVTIDIKLI